MLNLTQTFYCAFVPYGESTLKIRRENAELRAARERSERRERVGDEYPSISESAFLNPAGKLDFAVALKVNGARLRRDLRNCECAREQRARRLAKERF